MGRERSRRNWRPEWSIPALYAALSGAWIYGSDGLVAAVAELVDQRRHPAPGRRRGGVHAEHRLLAAVAAAACSPWS